MNTYIVYKSNPYDILRIEQKEVEASDIKQAIYNSKFNIKNIVCVKQKYLKVKEQKVVDT